MSNSLLIPNFSGNKPEFANYRLNYLDKAALSSNRCNHGFGLLGFIITPLEWLALPFPGNHVAVAFAPLQDPGLEPILANNANALAVSIYNAEWNAWKLHFAEFQGQRKEYSDFKNAFLDSLDPVSKDLMKDPIHGTRGITLREIDARLVAAYGIMSSADLSKNEDILRIPYRAENNLREFAASQRVAHAVALRNGQPFPEVQKVQFLLSALKPCAIFTLCCQMWQREFPQVINQTFELLVTAVQAFADNLTQDSTSSSSGFAAAATSMDTTDLHSLVATAVAAAVANLSSRPPVPRAPIATNASYCWTHGVGNHSSAKCRSPASGHLLNATLRNRLGGSNREAGRGRTSG